MIPAARESFAAAIRRQRLPYDAEVEWLETTGTQYFDTGLDSYRNTTASDLKLFRYEGLLAPMAVPSDRFLHGGNNWAYWGVNSAGNWVVGTGARSTYVVGTFYAVKVVFSASERGLWLNGTRVYSAAGAAGNSNVYGLGLSCIGNAGGGVTGGYAGKWRIGRIQVESTGVVRSFLPVRKDGVGYLYDETNGEFVAAKGGVVVVGPDKTVNLNGGGYKCLSYFSLCFAACSARLWKEAA